MVVGNALNDLQGSLIFLSKQSLASATTVTFSNFSTTYNDYFFVITNAVFVTNPDSFTMQYATGSGTVTSNYIGSAKDLVFNSTVFTNVQSTSNILLGNSVESYCAVMYVYNTSGTLDPSFTVQYVQASGTFSQGFCSFSNTTSPAAITSAIFSTGSGSGWSSGTISMYGIGTT